MDTRIKALVLDAISTEQMILSDMRLVAEHSPDTYSLNQQSLSFCQTLEPNVVVSDHQALTVADKDPVSITLGRIRSKYNRDRVARNCYDAGNVFPGWLDFSAQSHMYSLECADDRVIKNPDVAGHIAADRNSLRGACAVLLQESIN